MTIRLKEKRELATLLLAQFVLTNRDCDQVELLTASKSILSTLESLLKGSEETEQTSPPMTVEGVSPERMSEVMRQFSEAFDHIQVHLDIPSIGVKGLPWNQILREMSKFVMTRLYSREELESLSR